MSVSSILPVPSFTIDNATTKRQMAFRGNVKVQGELETSGTFAKDIVSRITAASFEKTTDMPGMTGMSENDYSADSSNSTNHTANYLALGKKSQQGIKDPSSLEASLKDTIDHVAQKYGYKAATAVMGIVYQKVGEKGVTEESLGEGFLNSIKVIDNNFGVDEGNNLMRDLNSGVNNELNTYFDNGKNETFFDAATLDPERLMKGAASAIAKALDGGILGSGEAEGASDQSDSSSSDASSVSDLPKTSDPRLASLKAKAKKLVAMGQLPPGYEEQYVQKASAGAMIDATV